MEHEVKEKKTWMRTKKVNIYHLDSIKELNENYLKGDVYSFDKKSVYTLQNLKIERKESRDIGSILVPESKGILVLSDNSRHETFWTYNSFCYEDFKDKFLTANEGEIVNIVFGSTPRGRKNIQPCIYGLDNVSLEKQIQESYKEKEAKTITT